MGSTVSLEGQTNTFIIESYENGTLLLGSDTNCTKSDSDIVRAAVGLKASDEIRALLERKHQLTSIAGTSHSASSGSEDSKYNSQEMDTKVSQPQSVGAITSTFVESKPIFESPPPRQQRASINDDSNDEAKTSKSKTSESTESIPPPLPQRNSSTAKIDSSISSPTNPEDAVAEKESEQAIQPTDEMDQSTSPHMAEAENAIVPAGLPKTLNSPVKTLPSLIIKDLFWYGY